MAIVWCIYIYRYIAISPSLSKPRHRPVICSALPHRRYPSGIKHGGISQPRLITRGSPPNADRLPLLTLPTAFHFVDVGTFRGQEATQDIGLTRMASRWVRTTHPFRKWLPFTNHHLRWGWPLGPFYWISMDVKTPVENQQYSIHIPHLHHP